MFNSFQLSQIFVFVSLLTAHLLSDFIFQQEKDVINKKKFKVFIKHILIVSFFSYLLLGIWDNFYVPMIILVGHAVIDLVKISFKKKSFKVYLLDQIAHILLILIIYYIIRQPLSGSIIENYYLFNLFGIKILQVYILVTAIIFTTKVSSIAIEFILLNSRTETDIVKRFGQDILSRRIGNLERLFMLVTFLSGIPEAIGFLITAKLILRYGEVKNEMDKKAVEFMLIGTLLSFTIGISIAFISSKILIYLG